MKPAKEDVRAMVGALMNVVSGIERAKREGKAGTLALLYVVAARQPVRPSELSAELGLHPSSVTRQVQALAAEGHVELTADPGDRRSCFISLTNAGREELERLESFGLDRFAAFVAAWDAEEVRALAGLLAKLEHSQAAVNRREPRAGGRAWQKKEQEP
jgi:DNA-binding MarR family transcriptional regulator